jgi:hypothetical protein
MFLTGTFFNSGNRTEQNNLAYLTHLLEEFFKPPVIDANVRLRTCRCFCRFFLSPCTHRPRRRGQKVLLEDMERIRY